MNKYKSIVFFADFILDEKSIASRRQIRMKEALSRYGSVETLTRIPSNDKNKISKVSSSFLKKIKKIDDIRKNWGAFRSHRFPDGQEIHYIKLALAVKTPPDLIVVSFGPYSTLLGAYILKIRFPKAKLWLDYRDLYYNNPNYSGIPFIKILEKKFNKLINKNADKITTVSKGLATEIPNCNDPVVVYNNADETIIYNKKHIPNVKCTELVLGYFGTYYEYYKIEGLIDYIRTLNCVVRFKIAGDCKKIKDILEVENIKNLSVEFYGMINKDEVKKYQEECNREIYFSSSHVGAGILSGKIFEYLARNMPIFVAGNEIDKEVGLVLDKIDDVIYENNAYCAVSVASSRPIRIVNNFEEVIDEIFIRH